MSRTKIGFTKWSGGSIQQMLDLSDDSTRFIDTKTGEELACVDSSGYTNIKGVGIGKFYLGNEKWSFKIEGDVFMTGDNYGMFELPEFELEVIPALLEKYHG